MQTNQIEQSAPLANKSFTSRYKKALHCLASDATKEDVSGNEQAAQLQSIIGMVHTLVEEDRVSELYDVFKSSFPEYYLNMAG